MAFSGERSAKDVVARFIESIGIHDPDGVIPFVRAWPSIVGTDNAAHSQILEVRNGAVRVGVDHPAWLQRLHLQQEQIVTTIQHRFPALEVRYVHFIVVDDVQPSVTPDIVTSEETKPQAGSETETESERETGAGVTVPQTGAITEEEKESDSSDGEELDASSDTDFQQHLKRLGDAIARRNHD